MRQIKSNGHWLYKKKLNPEDFFGFVYEIICYETGKKYIGKKQYYSYRKTKKIKEKNWREYTGSSKDLNADIRKYGKESCTFQVLKEYKTKGWLSYAECNWQHKLDVLTAVMTGTNERAYYNKSILAVRFIPNTDIHPEERKEIRPC